MSLTRTIGGLRFDYDSSVLEPRPWTVQQSLWAAALSPELPPGQILELCSGAGHIGLLAAHLTLRDVVLVDASASACAFARVNAERLGLAAQVRHGSMTQVLDEHERFPLILADPPYLRTRDISEFPDDPTTAIDGGDDGLDLARLTLTIAGRHLERAGAMLLQLRDHEQAAALRSWAGAAGLRIEKVRSVGDHGVLVLCRPLDREWASGGPLLQTTG